MTKRLVSFDDQASGTGLPAAVEGKIGEKILEVGNATYAPQSVATEVAQRVNTDVGPHPSMFGAKAALANASTERVDIFAYGDSLWEGWARRLRAVDFTASFKEF